MRRATRECALALALAAALVPAAARGQDAAASAAGVVEGRAVGSAGEALGFSLIVLAPADPARQRRTKLTLPDGSFRFDGVEPGEYRLLLERIGFQSESSPVLRVEAGRTVRHTITSEPRPVLMEGIVADGACFTGDRLAERPYLAALWAEAQKNAETRRAFESSYRYAFTLRQETRHLYDRPKDPEVRDTLVSKILVDPDSLAAREDARYRERNAYGRQRGRMLRLDFPEDRELLAEGFLRDHCLESRVSQVGGTWEFGFRPVRTRRGRIDVQGTVQVDTGTFRVRTLTFEYLQGDDPFFTATVNYGDFGVPGGTVRLPVGGTFSGRPQGRGWAGLKEMSGTVDYTDYRELQPVPERPPRRGRR